MDPPSPITCNECNKTFKTKTALIAHTTHKHEKPTETQCLICERVFSKRSNLLKHMNSKSHTIHQQKNTPKSIKCPLSCNFVADNKDKILKHYSEYHNITLEVKNLVFDNIEKFLEWKEKFEKDTGTHFVNSKGNVKRKTGTVIYFICDRDGYYKAEGKNIRLPRVKGSKKINSHCPAKITCRINDKGIQVENMDTHVGHEMEMDHLYITESEKKEICQKLKAKASFDEILNEAHNYDKNDKLKRINLLTRKDLWNIVNTYKLNHAAFKKRKRRNFRVKNENVEQLSNLDDINDTDSESIENEGLCTVDSPLSPNFDTGWEDVEHPFKIKNIPDCKLTENEELYGVDSSQPSPKSDTLWDKELLHNIRSIAQNEEQFRDCINQIGSFEHEIKSFTIKDVKPNISLIQDSCSELSEPLNGIIITKLHFGSSIKIKKKYLKFLIARKKNQYIN